MPNHSRRTFLVGAGAGVVAGVAATTAGSTAAAAFDRSPSDEDAPADGPVVAYVRDVGTGEIAVMSGDREVVFADRALAVRLARKLG